MKRIVLSALVVATLAPRLALACSACGCGDTGLSNLGLQFAQRGQWRATFEFRSTGQTTGVANDPTEFSDEKERRSALIVAYAPSASLVARAVVPGVRRSILDGDTGLTDKATSLGDAELQLRYDVLKSVTHTSSITLTAIGGVGVPSGANDIREAGVRLDEHVQPGTGAWSGTAGLALTYSEAKAWLYGSLTAKTFGANGHDFTYGRGVLLTTEMGRHVTPRLSALIGLAGRSSRRDRDVSMAMAGLPAMAAPGHGPRPNHGDKDPNGYLEETGGQVAFATPGVQVQLAPGALLRVEAFLPVWQHLNGTQHEKSNVLASLTYAW